MKGGKMKPQSIVTLVLGVILLIFGVFFVISSPNPFHVIPILIGAALCYMGWRGGRIALLVFGHACIILGCFLITWGMYLLPYSKPILSHIFLRPLFWGLISLFGGICANYHGFCKCIRK
jgi:uncharacterized membrane protein HdeD (DUF308 family)